MTIILFLVDTSASMNQKCYLGTSFLDLAKGAVDNFLKLRLRDPARASDRYMLLTFEDPPRNIKAGWKEPLAVFLQELKNLKATGLSTCGQALSSVFHLLNVNRLQSGIDTYGQGWCPFYLEPVMIVVITDGNCLTSTTGLQSQIQFNPHTVVGSELTEEPFRWDERMYALVLRVPGNQPESVPANAMIPSDRSPINDMCEATGGRSYTVSNHKMLNQCVESLVQKVQHGVVLRLEKYGPDPNSNDLQDVDERKKPIENGFGENGFTVETMQKKLLVSNNDNGHIRIASPFTSTGTGTEWHSTKRMIYVPRQVARGGAVGHWPIPECFWPDAQCSNLPSRRAHPLIFFKCEDSEPMVIENLPFDKYELEPSPLTQYILERKQPTSCWPVYVQGSSRFSELWAPFGYLKASTNLSCVNLFVMPYNYPKLLPILKEILHLPKGKTISKDWRTNFDKYLKTIPIYYQPFLKRALNRMNVGHVMPAENPETGLSASVNSYIKRVRWEAKVEFERICNSVAQPLSTSDRIEIVPRNPISLSAILRSAENSTLESLRKELNEFAGVTLHAEMTRRNPSIPGSQTATYRNPFEIHRRDLLQQICKMRANFMQNLRDALPVLEGGLPGTKLKLQNAEELHNLPVGQMGNYQDYLAGMPKPLKEIDVLPYRAHAFGNPFKVDKRMLVDEADIDILVAQGGASTSSAGSATSGSRAGGGGRRVQQQEGGQRGMHHNPHMRKRKAGPLPRDFKYRRRSSVSESGSESGSSAPASPASSEETSSIISDDELSSIASEDLDVLPSETENGASPTESLKFTDTEVPPLSLETFEKLQQVLRSLVRRPGKPKEEVLDALGSIKAPKSQTLDLIEFVIDQAQRFRKHEIVHKLHEMKRAKSNSPA